VVEQHVCVDGDDSLAQCGGCDSNSFTPETLVRMADGSSKPISEVKLGDQVLATDPETGATEARGVSRTIVGGGQKHLVDIAIDTDRDGKSDSSLTGTDGHPGAGGAGVPAVERRGDRRPVHRSAETCRTGGDLSVSLIAPNGAERVLK
jgi:hypothetical protein